MITVSVEGARATLTLDRPDKANALTSEMLADLVAAVREAGRREDVHALILTGRGRVFSAGADLDEVRGGDLATSPLWEALSGAVAACPVLTVAALNGSLAGGAMGMALACDLRVAVSEARFFYPVMRMGVLPQPSDPARLAALVGPARAKLLLMGAEKIDADTALAWGLIDAIDPDPCAAAHRLTEAAADVSRGHVTAVKAACA